MTKPTTEGLTVEQLRELNARLTEQLQKSTERHKELIRTATQAVCVMAAQLGKSFQVMDLYDVGKCNVPAVAKTISELSDFAKKSTPLIYNTKIEADPYEVLAAIHGEAQVLLGPDHAQEEVSDSQIDIGEHAHSDN